MTTGLLGITIVLLLWSTTHCVFSTAVIALTCLLLWTPDFD